MPFLKQRNKTSVFAQKVEKSKRNGWRHAIFSTHKFLKDKYTGQWKNDVKEGIGIEITRNNYLYRGEWANDKKQGFGILTKILKNGNTERRYSGCWCQGKKHGFGIYWYSDGFYKGYFMNDMRNGFGKMWWDDGKYYEGTWKNDLFHGDGILVMPNGNRYKGQFIKGKKNGSGTYYHKNTGQTQTGVWSNDACLSSTMEDAYFRQSAITPTPFPIPPFIQKDL